MITGLNNHNPFPPVASALTSPNGLLATGGDLCETRLLDAYRHGIFPWFNRTDPILWWSPDPRMVLFPGEFKTSRSLAKVLCNTKYEVRCDTAFEQVMHACAAPRSDLLGEYGGTPHATWISADMIAAYGALHQSGYAHSVEVWINNHLAGGLYGVAIGRMFYGESMFSHTRNASKIALAHLAKQLLRWQSDPASQPVAMIDCQMYTPHLASLGAREIPRSEFISRLQELVHCAPIAKWQFDHDLFT